MKLFELKTAILVVIILVIIRFISMNFVHSHISINYGLQQAMLFDVILDLILILIGIVYFFAYIIKWNKGEAKFF